MNFKKGETPDMNNLDIKIFANTVDPKAVNQVITLAELPAFAGSKIRIMPDVHAGAGCVIGFTANLGEKVIPNIVGVDIGCGMLATNIGTDEVDFEKLDDIIRTYVPSGRNVHEVQNNDFNIDELYCCKELKNKDWLNSSLGTLGGGNHFIEIDINPDTNEKWLVIHSGSRNLGKQVADIYQNKAILYQNSQKDEVRKIIDKLKSEGREKEIESALNLMRQNQVKVPNELCWLEGKLRDDYLHDMKLCQVFANKNRQAIADTIIKKMGFKVVDSFTTRHNYIDDSNMVRKGAISAHKNERVLIPMNMKDGCILGAGKGNEEWNCSAPHGAGRLMSRSEAKTAVDLQEYIDCMSDVYTSSVSMGTIDEAPQVYKSMEEILGLIGETVNVEAMLKPIYNFKASEEK